MSRKEELMLYLFDSLLDDEIFKSLEKIKNHENPDVSFYKSLIDFVQNKAYTTQSVKEYIIRFIFKSHIDISDIIIPYIKEDIEILFDDYFKASWDKLCSDINILPLPRNEKKGTANNEVYSSIISKIVKRETAEEIINDVIDFYNSYYDEDEAKFSAFTYIDKLEGIDSYDNIKFENLCGIEYQKETIISNTKAFLNGLPANDILLVGRGGTGKSSLVKALLSEFDNCDLKIAEIGSSNIKKLPRLLDDIAKRKQKYIVFLDDLSFRETGEEYLALKVALDGQLSKRPDNLLIYATSNRRHLINESFSERENDIHESDTINEKISLSERFGIHLHFGYLSQEEYLKIVKNELELMNIKYDEDAKKEAVKFVVSNNERSGRSANQFAKYYASKTNKI